MNILLKRKLTRWHEHGLIDSKTHEEICNFENQSNKANVLYGMLFLGAFAIIVGLISIIAANWDLVPASVKLASNLLLLIALAVGINYSHNLDKKNLKETLIIIFFGSILGSIALIGQIYHLESHRVFALSTWMVLGTPVMWLSYSKYPAYLWGLCLIVLLESFASYFVPNAFKELDVLTFIGLASLFISMGLTKVENPNFKKASIEIGSGFLILVIMLLGSFRWASPVDGNSVWYSLIAIICSVPLALAIKKMKSTALMLLFLVGILFLETPNLFAHESLKLLGAIFFILLWASIGAYGVRINEKKIFDYSCLVIAIRLFFIYIEVFGTLLETGIGLVASGVVILVIAYGWQKNKDKIWSWIGVKND